MSEIYINIVDIAIRFLSEYFCCITVIEYYIFLSLQMLFEHFSALI